jgi:hypothetical protein
MLNVERSNVLRAMNSVTGRAYFMTDSSLKSQAQEIMTTVDQQLQTVEAQPPVIQKEVDDVAKVLMRKLFGVIHDVDIKAATERVAALRQKYPDDTPEQLAQRLIRDKIQRTGAVGAVTSSAGLIPGIGTAAALTLGVAADIGATFRLQAELVLEIAAVYDYPLTESEKQRLVMLITGLSAGTSALARKAGEKIALEVGERFAEKAIIKALPVVGVIASAGTNALSTYIIGQRADAYFRLGPEAVPTWSDSLRAISGVDERKIVDWLADSGRSAGDALAWGAAQVGEAGKAASEAVVSGAGRVADTVGPAMSSGAKKAGATAQKGLSAYVRFFVNFWTGIFRFVFWLLGAIWAIIAFIPRKIAGLFKRNKKVTNQPD